MQIVQLPLAKLTPDNIREIDEEHAKHLAESMRTETGQITPIHVTASEDGTTTIIHGHHRVVAAQILGWETITAIIIDPLNPASKVVSQFYDNELHKSLSYTEKAGVYRRLKEMGMAQGDIAKALGISDADVSLALASLRACPKIQQAISEGRLSPSAIEPLLSLPVEEQEELADAAIQAKTVRKVHDLVSAHKTAKGLDKKRAKKISNEIPEDADPLETLAIDELNQALEHLEAAATTPIITPALVRKVRPTVEELLRHAESLKVYLDGNGWADLADLI